MSGDKLPTLAILLPSGLFQVHVLTTGRTTIGRAPSNQVIVHDRRVSRVHAAITVEHAFVTIEDLGSTNGVWLNGRKLMQEPLTDGDVLTLGDSTLHFAWENPNDVCIEAEPMPAVPGLRLPGHESKDTE
ncbi:FHA domain-containing protein [Variovorax sp. N23]|uniref:FHA domain-containing protein n=1 Tax=Variovorax sp. N23 TaxID=2980555 RepID=UPI0021C59051|nr:FHA domain-containing protein [Variovorax sp. N23]MCU4119417.1 FHA domain-containing protein [Variovorax sp. N23]